MTNTMWTDSMEHTATRFMYNQIICPLAVATQNAVAQNAFEIVPNPTTQQFTVRITDLPSAYTVQMTDVLGNIVRVQKAYTTELTIPRDNLPAGT